MAAAADSPHLPYPAPIEAYGDGGFRFAGMSHRGSLMCLPDGIWAWPVTTPEAIDDNALALAFDRAATLDLFLLGCGREVWIMPEALRGQCRERGLKLDVMPTGAAVHTYNIVLAEGRRVGAALIAVA
jgi:uncharacterized protein